MSLPLAPLRMLARAHGVQAGYTDAFGRRRTASRAALAATLGALGVELENADDLQDALRHCEHRRWQRMLPPVAVAWDEDPLSAVLRLPVGRLRARAVCRVTLEDGSVVERSFRPEGLAELGRARVDRREHVALRLSLSGPWPPGYHRLEVLTGDVEAGCRFIRAPRRAYGRSPANVRPRWGLFCPLYALHGERSWGVGDLADLGAVLDWTEVQGGRLVATLPLLAAFLDEPFEPGPYRPVSRRHWNELFVAVEEIPELDASPEARELLRSPSFARKRRRLRATPDVDYRRAMALKRDVLLLLTRTLDGQAGERRAAFRRFLDARPDVGDYARFRATVERRGETWRTWPARMRDGSLRKGDFDEAAARYHAYVQWIAEQQLGRITEREVSPGLCLDLPLGAHPDGYDVWRERAIFAPGAGVGCPPDRHFTNGQAWGFPPLHPERSREAGHAYFRECLSRQMRFAGVLRIDHVMALHRLFWIPEGFPTDAGVYVRYPAEELHALVCLESHRQRCRVVGEDLGVVPREVRSALRRHNLRRTFVVQGLGGTPAGWDVGGVATTGTHDMPTFAAYWKGDDIGERVRLGLLDRSAAVQERQRRAREREDLAAGLGLSGRVTARKTLEALVSFLGDSRAETVLLNLEDLWLETRAQNVPGTTVERPNWRGKTRHPFEGWRRLPEVLRVLRDLDLRRKDAPGGRA